MLPVGAKTKMEIAARVKVYLLICWWAGPTAGAEP
jgi:hypothetical protein